MQWDFELLKNEKYMVLDAIIKFSKDFSGKDASEISLKDLTDFIDDFFEER